MADRCRSLSRDAGRWLLAGLLGALILTAGCSQGHGELAEQTEPDWVPLAGVEATGRIPKVERPDDIACPERWRYIPAGRLKPGSMAERFLYSTFFLPVVFYDEEVGLGGGVAITDLDFRNTKRREFAGIVLSYTTEGQETYALRWRRWLHHRRLPNGGVIHTERSAVEADLGYQRTLTRRFFGFGDDTTEDDETSYTDERSYGGLGADKALPYAAGNWIVSLHARGEHHNLAGGKVEEVPSTEEVFPALVEAGDDHDSVWITAGIAYDQRDSQTNPYTGWRLGLRADNAVWVSDEETGSVFHADISRVCRLPGLFHSGGDPDEEHPPTDTLGMGARLDWVEGDLPFYYLPTLGGSDTLRGFVPHRWTGRAVWHAGLEYRFWLLARGFTLVERIPIERVGMALFVEAGGVAAEVDRLDDADVLWSAGASLRVSLDRKGLFRGDIGYSEEGINVTGGYGVSF